MYVTATWKSGRKIRLFIATWVWCKYSGSTTNFLTLKQENVLKTYLPVFPLTCGMHYAVVLLLQLEIAPYLYQELL